MTRDDFEWSPIQDRPQPMLLPFTIMKRWDIQKSSRWYFTYHFA